MKVCDHGITGRKGTQEVSSPTSCPNQDQLWDQTLVFKVYPSRSWKPPRIWTAQAFWSIHYCGMDPCGEKVYLYIHMKPALAQLTPIVPCLLTLHLVCILWRPWLHLLHDLSLSTHRLQLHVSFLCSVISKWKTRATG